MQIESKSIELFVKELGKQFPTSLLQTVAQMTSYQVKELRKRDEKKKEWRKNVEDRGIKRKGCREKVEDKVIKKKRCREKDEEKGIKEKECRDKEFRRRKKSKKFEKRINT